MKIDNLWPTPVGVLEEKLSFQSTVSLIEMIRDHELVVKRTEKTAIHFKDYVESSDFYNNVHYNFFDETEESPFYDAVKDFEKYACRHIRNYLRDAFGAKDYDTVQLSGRCFGHTMVPGNKTFPHYHHTSDVVLIHYLNVGESKEPLSLILQEPRGAPNYPWWGKMHVIIPKTGMTVIHPSFLWHQASEWSGEGPRDLIGVNFKVLGHGNETNYSITRF
jgi:hypothetical protein